MSCILLHGDCEQLLLKLSGESLHALVTDPPAGIGFMGRAWDGDRGGRAQWVAWLAGVMRECLRVLKPGAHALVWALPRTSHWTATALEDAGFEIRDVVMHLFGTGFPKSLDVSKALDKAAGVAFRAQPASGVGFMNPAGAGGYNVTKNKLKRAGKSTPAAQQWDGWGTALKPAAEHWILCRKPLVGTVAANVAAHGTGALNIDGCRIATADGYASNRVTQGVNTARTSFAPAAAQRTFEPAPAGRWPAHLTLDESAAALLDAQSGHLKSGAIKKPRQQTSGTGYGSLQLGGTCEASEGGASRFFYVAKASRAERGKGNKHPTVKPLALMRWLLRLVTPPGGTVLDPFAGSGSTGVAAALEGFDFIGMEQEAEFAATARERIGAVTGPLFTQGVAP